MTRHLDAYSNSEIRHIINEYIHSERDRDLLLDRWVNGYTYERLGELYDLSDVQVKRIVRKQSERLSTIEIRKEFCYNT